MQFRDQIIKVLLSHGITRTYKGFLPLVDLVQLYMEKTVLWSQAVEMTAARYGVSAATLRARVRSVARGMERRETGLSGGGYRMEDFIAGIALVAARQRE